MSTPIPTTREEQERYVQHALARAEELRKQRNYQEGISLLVDALQYGVEKAQLYYRLGNIYFDGGDLGRAEYVYKRALEVDPHHVNAMHNLAVVYKQQQKISLYVKTYKKSQRLALRFPRTSSITPEQKKRLRWLSGKVLFWIIAALGAVALLLWLFMH